eukprot:Pgem_evm1s7767
MSFEEVLRTKRITLRQFYKLFTFMKDNSVSCVVDFADEFLNGNVDSENKEVIKQQEEI